MTLGAVIGLLVSLLLLVLVLWIVYAIGKAIIGVLPIEPAGKNLAMTLLYVIILLVCLSVLVGFTGWLPGWRVQHIRW